MYFGDSDKSYAGLGAGMYQSSLFYKEKENFVCIPGFVGMQGNKFFGDFGVDFIASKESLLFMPVVRFGYCF